MNKLTRSQILDLDDIEARLTHARNDRRASGGSAEGRALRTPRPPEPGVHTQAIRACDPWHASRRGPSGCCTCELSNLRITTDCRTYGLPSVKIPTRDQEGNR